MRMRKKPNLIPRMEACAACWVKNPEEMKGNWRSLKPDCTDVRIEVGCGKGTFTVKTAEANPTSLIIAIELCSDAMVVGMERAKEMGLTNVFFVAMNVAKIDECFAPGEADLLYINFCDPWPRSKNAKRRLTFHTFLDRYRIILKEGGEVHFKTDNAPLFEWSLEEFAAEGLEVKNLTRDLHANGPVGIMTDYEAKFHEMGVPINRCEIIMTAKKEEKAAE